MKIITTKDYKPLRTEISNILENFEILGRSFMEGQRNSIRIFSLDGKQINIKSFKIPNAINKIAYKFFRKSKAERSFNYARILIEKGIGTPAPIGYAEENLPFTFGKSFYASEHLESDLTFRELVTQPDYPQNESILRAFTRFTFQMHEQNVEFLDHSPGNTLIKLNNGNYQFFLVDLNRMNFGEMSFDARMKNFSRLTPKKAMVEVMANEYANFIQKSETEVFEKMWFYTCEFQQKFRRKQMWKEKLRNK